MKVFTVYHDGVYMGGESVVVAPNKRRGLELLNEELKHRGLKKAEPNDLREVPLKRSSVIVLNDGDY